MASVRTNGSGRGRAPVGLRANADRPAFRQAQRGRCGRRGGSGCRGRVSYPSSRLTPGVGASGGKPRALDPAVPQAAQPGCCLSKLSVGGARPDLGPAAVVAWVAAEELHVRADPAQAHQRLAYPRVIEVPLAVDRETVLAEPVAGGARLDPGEVDAAHGELGKQFHQRTG